ncbi:MAG: DUF4326 domain-containing protein [Deltaproteobacteria bacterium]|nr:DUF4326 domain-containing protein [Deltaproteobacteria bacterium]
MATDRKTTVVNVHLGPCDVCIMRPSIFRNPYEIGRDGERADVIVKFRSYFYNRTHSDPKFWAALQELKGKRLGCCCKPKDCHGDVIAAWLNV